MATVVDPTTAVQKQVDVSIKDRQIVSDKVFLLEIWSTGNFNSEKTIEVKDENKNISGTFKQVQFKFDKDNNYIYTKFDVNQKGLDKKYSGTALEFSISGLSAGNANTVIRTAKTNSASDLTELYNGSAERVDVKVEKVTGEAEPTLPTDGTPQPDKGANKDVKTWKTAQMNQDASLWKVVDDKNINVADQFHSEANAQQYIDYYKSKYQPSPEPTPQEPGPEPSPGGEIIEDGIKMFYPRIGQAQTFAFKSGNKGRSQYVCNLKKPLINMEVTGILDLKKVDNPGEEVSIKTRGGPHSDNNPKAGSCYISGVKYDGKVNNQYESPHPTNHAMSLHKKAGNFNPGSVVGKKFGIKNIVFYDPKQDKDVIKVYLDMKLDNDWKLFWETTSTQFKNKENSDGKPMVFFRMDDIPGAPDSDANAKLTKGTVREISPKA